MYTCYVTTPVQGHVFEGRGNGDEAEGVMGSWEGGGGGRVTHWRSENPLRRNFGHCPTPRNCSLRQEREREREIVFINAEVAAFRHGFQ